MNFNLLLLTLKSTDEKHQITNLAIVLRTGAIEPVAGVNVMTHCVEGMASIRYFILICFLLVIINSSSQGSFGPHG